MAHPRQASFAPPPPSAPLWMQTTSAASWHPEHSVVPSHGHPLPLTVCAIGTHAGWMAPRGPLGCGQLLGSCGVLTGAGQLGKESSAPGPAHLPGQAARACRPRCGVSRYYPNEGLRSLMTLGGTEVNQFLHCPVSQKAEALMPGLPRAVCMACWWGERPPPPDKCRSSLRLLALG